LPERFGAPVCPLGFRRENLQVPGGAALWKRLRREKCAAIGNYAVPKRIGEPGGVRNLEKEKKKSGEQGGTSEGAGK